MPLVNEKMVIRWSDIDPAVLNPLSVQRVGCLKGGGSGDDLRQDAITFSSDMDRDEYGCG